MDVGQARRAVQAPLVTRVARIAIPSVAALAVISGGVVALQSGESQLKAEPGTAPSAVAAERTPRVTRDAARSDLEGAGKADKKQADAQAKKNAALKKAAGKSDQNPSLSSLASVARGKSAGSVYATSAVNVRSTPAADGKVRATVDAGSRLQATDVTVGAWRQVVYSGDTAWVTAKYVSSKKPATKKSSSAGSKSSSSSSSRASAAGKGVSGGSCAGGSSVENGLQPATIKVHRAICNAFPQIKSYGGVRADSLPAHPSGRALDSMIPNYSSSSGNALGWQVANYARAHASELGITEVIFDQKIWTTQRSGEGWRSMSSRGGATANHRDHVHVTVG